MLDLLVKLFGKAYVNRMIGTGTNVSKPIKLDKNSPFKLYSDSAFNDPDVLQFIEKKLMEYGPYALSNKNASEIANFEMNARRALNARKPKESQVKKAAEAMFGPLGKKTKPEAEIVDIATQKPVSEKGIATLKSEIGLPEGVEPGSIADKAIQESAQYKMDQQGVKSLLDENYKAPKTTSIADDMSLDEALEKELSLEEVSKIGDEIKASKMSEQGAKAYSANIESYRRPIIRQMLLKDTRINLPKDVRESLLMKNDLQRGADPKMDPLRLLDEYYDVDFKKLDELEDIRFTAGDEFEAADEFLQKGGLELKKTKTVEDYTKDGDFDPGGMAEGGRIGFKKGKSKGLIDFINKKFGKGTVTTAENMELSPNVLQKKMFEDFNKRNRKLTDEEYDDLVEEYGEGVPYLETVGDAEKFVASQKAYEAAMYRDYKAGKLDPKPGEPGRKRFLEKMKEEAEMSGDKRLFTIDEAEELEGMQQYGGIKNAKIPIELITADVIKVKYPGISDELAELIGNDTNLQRKAEALASIEQAMTLQGAGKSADETIEILKGEPKTKMSKGGLARILEM